jgi:hypothetical protein
VEEGPVEVARGVGAVVGWCRGAAGEGVAARAAGLLETDDEGSAGGLGRGRRRSRDFGDVEVAADGVVGSSAGAVPDL